MREWEGMAVLHQETSMYQQGEDTQFLEAQGEPKTGIDRSHAPPNGLPGFPGSLAPG